MSDKNKRKRGPGRHKRIKALACIKEIDERLMRGDTARSVSIFIQEEQMELTDIASDSLTTLLGRYRKDMKPLDVAAIHAPKWVIAAMQKLEGGLSELDQLTHLYAMQLERVSYGMIQENGGIPNNRVNESVRIAAEILMKSHQVKMDLGVNGPRELGTIRVTGEELESVQRKYGERVYETLMNPESRGKVLAIVERIAHKRSTESSADEVIDVNAGDDDRPQP